MEQIEKTELAKVIQKTEVEATYQPAKARVIAFTCSKGGVGKTTVSVTLALLLVSLGYKVKFIDTDPQGTGSFYFTERAMLISKRVRKEQEKLGADEETIKSEIEKTLKKELPEVVDKKSGLEVYLNQISYDFNYIIIDTQGADTSITREASTCANWIYILFSYSGFDVKALETTISDVLKAQSYNKTAKVFLLPNMVEKRNTLVNRKGKEKALKILSEILNMRDTTAEERNIFFLNTEISYKSAYTAMDGGNSIFELTKGKTLDPVIEYQNLLEETVTLIESTNKEAA